MGNCLFHDSMMNERVLAYKPPMQVQEVPSQFEGHAISDDFPATGSYIHPDASMTSGSLYYFLQQKSVDREKPPETSKPAMRIKLVITRQELRETLTKGGLTIDDMISHLQRSPCNMNKDFDEGNFPQGHRGWKPVLQSIPEMGEFK